MQKVARFEKVSRDNFLAAMGEDYGQYSEAEAEAMYEELKLPRRATKGSAGYDFFAPFDFTLAPGETIKIPTGIRSWMLEDWVLQIYPRSGLGFKFRLQLDNTVGIIDSDYYNSSNEGHIMIKITNNSLEGKTVSVKQGEAFAQGVFVEYGITVDDDADGVRDGGFGSTDAND